LFKQNNEAKVRRSTKSTIVGKAKVKSYEDIVEERAKWGRKKHTAVQEQVKGRNSKSARNPALAPSKFAYATFYLVSAQQNKNKGTAGEVRRKIRAQQGKYARKNKKKI